MTTHPLSSVNFSDWTGAVTGSASPQEHRDGPLPLWNFHSILVDPASSMKQARQAKLRMLEVLEASEIFRDRPMLVPELNVPEPDGGTIAEAMPPSLSTPLFV